MVLLITMSLLKRETKMVETPPSVRTDYTGAHPVLAFKHTVPELKNDHLDDYVQVKPFENSEGLGSWLGKKKKQVDDHFAKKKSDNAAKSTVAALRKANKSVDAQLKNAWEVVEKQRRKDNEPTSGDAAAKKKLFGEIRGEIWSELKRKRRSNKETEAFDKEILAAFDSLKNES